MKRFLFVIATGALAAAPVAAAPPTLTLKSSSPTALYSGAVTLSGVLSTARTGQSVDIQAQECGQNAFKKIATVTTTTGGAYTSSVKPTLNTTYQAKQKGATSPQVTVKVVPKLTLRKTGSRPTRKFAVTLTSAQSFVGKYVLFQKRTSVKWKTVKKVTLTSVKPGTAPTQVTSQNFGVRIKGHPKVRVILVATQAGNCYLPATSNAVRS